jgi:hypothetical protein
MLRELRVRDLAVIENVIVPFEAGLNVLTGETGAGKSILIDAVLLLRGARAQVDVIRGDAESARVENVSRSVPAAPPPRFWPRPGSAWTTARWSSAGSWSVRVATGPSSTTLR